MTDDEIIKERIKNFAEKEKISKEEADERRRESAKQFTAMLNEMADEGAMRAIIALESEGVKFNDEQKAFAMKGLNAELHMFFMMASVKMMAMKK